MINLPIPLTIPGEEYRLWAEVLRRTVDGTVVPLFIDPSRGAIGIGTTTPAWPYTLDVNGMAKFRKEVMMEYLTVFGAIDTRNIDCRGSASFNILSASKAYLSGLDAFGVSYFSGNVGIGTAASASHALDIKTHARLSGILTLGAGDPTVDGGIAFDGGNDDIAVGDGSNTQKIRVGAWSAWTPTYTGFTGAVTTALGRYCVMGKMVSVVLDANGTSNATTMTFTLPVASKSAVTRILCAVGDNGAVGADPGRIDLGAASTTATVSLNLAGAAFTNSGNKAIYASFTYEAA